MVKIDGVVKKIDIDRRPEKEGPAKLVARVIIEFEPTERGISELQDLIAMQNDLVNIQIVARQIEMPGFREAK